MNDVKVSIVTRNALAPLNAHEESELSRYEAILHKGWESFVAAGLALAQIRDQRLYRGQYRTFEEYCRQKWDYRKSHVYRLIAAAEVVKCLSPIGDIPQPIHEAQVRPLIGLTPEQVREIWKKAAAEADGEAIKAAVVKEMASEVLPKKSSTKVKIRKRPSLSGVAAALKHLADLEAAIRASKSPETLLKCLGRVRGELTRLKGL